MPGFFGWMFNTKANDELTKERLNLLRDNFIAEEKGYNNQLNGLGLALLMSLFADKENDINQPIIANGSLALVRAVKILVQCDVGTEMTIIFIATGNHKLVVNLQKITDKKIKAICMDSISDNSYRMELNSVLERALPKDFTMTSYMPNYPELKKNKYFSIQSDFHQCGTFACKFARVFTKQDSPEIKQMLQDKTKNSSSSRNETITYDIPAVFLKSIQDTWSRNIIDQYRMKQEVNPRKGYTLENILKKYNNSDYVDHFTEKYYRMIKDFCINHDIAEIKRKITKYNAETISNGDIKKMNEHSRCHRLSRI